MQAGYAPPPGYGAPPPIAAAPPGGAYEFSPQENVIIEKAGSRARTWGTMSIVLGALLVVIAVVVIAVGGAFGLPIGLGILAFAIQPLVSGKFYHSAGVALRDVVQTSGNDVELMMNAVRKITVAVKVEAIAAIVGAILGFVVGFALATTKKG